MENKVFLQCIMDVSEESIKNLTGENVKIKSSEKVFSTNMNSNNSTIELLGGEIETLQKVKKGWHDTIWVVVLASGAELYLDALTTKGLLHGIEFPK